MKISNETKIGALASVTIVLMILGYNFLKGKDLFAHNKKIYAKFRSVEGLESANAVSLKGLQIGTVTDIAAGDKNVDQVVVTITLKQDVNIPSNSTGIINGALISPSSIEIRKGDAADFLKDGDTILTETRGSLISEVQGTLSPVISRLSSTLGSLDSLIRVVGSLFDPRLKNNFSSIVANLEKSSASLQIMLNSQSGALAKTLSNVDSFTGNLSRNNSKITSVLSNLDKTTGQLADSKLDETLKSANSAMTELKDVVSKVNSPNGSLGLLINDKKLYNNLEGTTRSLNTLLDDVRVHPKRYVNISVFGRKEKGNYLAAPIGDSSSPSPKSP